MTTINKKGTEEPNHTEKQVHLLAKAVGSWFIRRDGKFYDVNRLTTALSRTDIERICVFRIRQSFPNLELSSALLRATFDLAIQSRHSNIEQSIPVWNGSQSCAPDEKKRVIWNDGAVAVNTWKQPPYRDLRINQADLGIAGQFFDTIFKHETEKEMFLNWLAWNLQNENEKPAWAPFFYSRTKGTGKSTLCSLVGKLFGEANTVTQNSVEKLTAQFNMTLLQSKLIISEELQLKPDSAQANRLKTYITDPYTLAEQKGRDAEMIKQRCCFLFTSNHLPLWLEPEERRYYLIEMDHDGHAAGENAERFSELVGKLHEFMEVSENIAKVYNALMARKIPSSFSPKTLNIARDSTALMKRIHASSRLTSLDQLEEQLNKLEVNALPEAEVSIFIKENIGGNINQTKHLMSELHWHKTKVKWDGVDYARAIWVHPDYFVENGKLFGPDGTSESISEHLKGDVEVYEMHLGHSA